MWPTEVFIWFRAMSKIAQSTKIQYLLSQGNGENEESEEISSMAVFGVSECPN